MTDIALAIECEDWNCTTEFSSIVAIKLLSFQNSNSTLFVIATTLFLTSVLANSYFSSADIILGAGLVIYSSFTTLFLSSMNDFVLFLKIKIWSYFSTEWALFN